jgi:predicted regulator of Ras-like GTPase activity (Roadblock/LC7/MglB family)
MPDLGAPVSLTLEGENGALHLLRMHDKVIALTTTRDANIGAVRLEMRDAINDIDAD